MLKKFIALKSNQLLEHVLPITEAPTLFQLETVYAGMKLDRDGTAVPGLMGRLCQWTSSRPAVTFTSYQDFHNRWPACSVYNGP